ncbi:LytR/AlgR family response regulator transcription factor [Ulvibacterium marinum]|uniref:LytR/AlgR family response regulator transcription factor n=1 Tax=Ulvibacterium marinum TaxID=2419782 RepID=UPI002494A3F0|nr:response regulator transcription factor [Ulvibacterium marinum]
MRCVIIDDEPLAIDVLTKHLKKTQGLTLLRSFQNAFEALYYVQTQRVDLIFLDIQMPGIKGLQFIRILKYPPKIIITTAYTEYALEALELGVVDYLLKPIPYHRFLSAVSKAMEMKSMPKASLVGKEIGKDRYFFFKEDSTYLKVYERDIGYVHGNRNYCNIYLQDRKIKVKGNLGYYCSVFSEDNFARVHKSYLVSLDRIEKYDSDSLWIKGDVIPIGRTYKTVLWDYLKRKTL